MAPKLLVAVLLAGERAAELGGPWVACRRPAQGGAGALHVPPLAPCIGGKTRPALVARRALHWWQAAGYAQTACPRVL